MRHGHNQTEYGAHLLDICYTCHGSPANPAHDEPGERDPRFSGRLRSDNNTPDSDVQSWKCELHGGGCAERVLHGRRNERARHRRT